MSSITERYETTFAQCVGAAHAVSFAFARHALIAILRAAGLHSGDEVILSPLTCKVIPLSLLSLGLRPVYTDISESTLNLDPARVRAAITPTTRAILFQHTYGHAGGIEEVAELADLHRLLLVEDCAQCMPIVTDSYRPGRHGSCAVFSNNPGKPLPAASGGMAVASDARLTDAIRTLRDQLPRRGLRGEAALIAETWLHRHLLRPSLYWMLFDLHRQLTSNTASRSLEEEISSEITCNAFRPSQRQIRLGMQWLQNIATLAEHRHSCCEKYESALDYTNGITLPLHAADVPLYYYPVLVDNKAELLRRARRRRVEIIPWPVAAPVYPLEKLSQMQMLGYSSGDCPQAESVAIRLVGLPTHEKVTERVLEKVIALLRSQ